MANPISLLLVLLIVPLVWSALIQMIRYLAGHKPAVLHDRTEKAVMAVMLLPSLIGLVFLNASPLVAPLNRAHVLYPPVFDEVAEVAVKALPRLAPQGPDMAAFGAQVALILYFAGLAFTLWRLWRSHNRLTRIVRTAQPTQGDQNVLCSDVSSLAFAWGARRIIVPSVLFERLTIREFELVLAHERAHQRRGDPFYFLALSLIEAVFWFNPLFARQARACRLAAELACDAAVVGDAPKTRKAYARALMLALKYASGQDMPETNLVPALLSDKETYKMRLSQILTRTARPRKASVLLAGMVTLAAPVLMLQMAFAEGHQWPAALNLTAAISPVATPRAVETKNSLFHTMPVDSPVSSGFGARKDPTTGKFKAHGGLDFEVPVGTPVKAPASGTVTGAGVWGAYGQVVEIDHGSGIRTLFAHLSQTGLKWGDHVSEGQVIALSGNSGQSSHPHLHMEVRQNGKRIDPAISLGLSSQ